MTYWLEQYIQDEENAFDVYDHGFLRWNFFLGGTNLSAVPPVYLRI